MIEHAIHNLARTSWIGEDFEKWKTQINLLRATDENASKMLLKY